MAWDKLDQTFDELVRLRADNDRLHAVIRKAVEGLDGGHHMDNDIEHPVCVVCYPADDRWPCVSLMVADDLRASVESRALPGEET